MRRISRACTNPPELWVRIEDGPGIITPAGVGPSFAYSVSTHDIVHFGNVATREQAWACALSTLRGMLALERLRA